MSDDLALLCRGLVHVYREAGTDVAALRGVDLVVPAGAARRRARPVGLGQVDAALDRRRGDAALGRPRRGLRHRPRHRARRARSAASAAARSAS